jgi:hypothetical protein
MTFQSLVVRAATLISTSLLVASCGGGNNADAGSLTAFNIVPTSITLTGPNENTCGGGYGGRVYVYGGAGPYSINNSGGNQVGVPGSGFVTINKTIVDRQGEFFEVTLNGGCMTNIQIIVVDQLGRQSTLSVSSVKGEGP